jgi:Tfp pilus assembly protein FimT
MSLTESCIAAMVAATSLAVTLPALNRTMDIYKLQSAAHSVATAMQSARIAAINRSRDCRVSVTSATTYGIECDEGSWRRIQEFTMPRRITIEANARPEFHRRGNVSPTATLTLRNPSGAVRRVIVNVNGRVRIQ